jgi:hypothetical protein
MKTTTIHRATQASEFAIWQRPMAITLPYVDGVAITQDRSETAPTCRVIRGEGDWRDSKTLAMAARVR